MEYLLSNCQARAISLNLRLIGDVGAVEVEVAHQLHGDGGEALLDPLGLDVDHQGAHEPFEVDAVVVVEALVLDGHQGVPQDVGDLLAADDRAVFAGVQVGKKRVVGGVDHGGLGEMDVALSLKGGQPLLHGRDRLHAGQGHRGHDTDYENHDSDWHCQPNNSAALPGRVGPADSRSASFSTDPHTHLNKPP